jgi:ABC-2 type transport system permease protein
MNRLLALWHKEWLALSRDVHGLAVLFVMPVAFIVVMSLALGDAFKEDGGRPLEFSVLAADGAAFAGRFAQRLAAEGARARPAPPDESAAREAVRLGSPALVVILPRGFEQALGEPPTPGRALPGLILLADPALPPAQTIAFQHRVRAAVLALRVAELTRRAGLPTDPVTLDPGKSIGIAVEAVGTPRAGRPSSVQQNVPAWLIFGMFFVVMPLSSLFIVERREGTLARLASQQVPFPVVLLGKVGPFFAINMGQTALMLLAGRSLVPWLGGEALALPQRWDVLVLVAACTSLAAIGWGLLVAVTARTMEQATVIGGVGNILAAAIGGIMVPRFIMPAGMQRWADLSPMAWALEGFHTVILRQGSLADAAAPCAKLVALAAALLAAAVWIYRGQRS